MPDRLRSMIRRFDQDNARAHRLTGDPVVAPRGDSSVRRVCGKCWHVVDEQAELSAWREKVGCDVANNDWPAKPYKCFPYLAGQCQFHPYPGVLVCPKCGADSLGEVVG
jgi:hypothetical protein